MLHALQHTSHDDVIRWKHFPRYWPLVWGIHRSPVNSPYKGQWRRALMFSLICAWIYGWVNNGEAGDLRCHHAHYDVIVMHTSGTCGVHSVNLNRWMNHHEAGILWNYDIGLILGLLPANERHRCNSHWLGANLESALWCILYLSGHSTDESTPITWVHI